MELIKVGESEQFRVKFSDGVTDFPLPGTPLWTVASGFGNILISNPIMVNEFEARVTMTGAAVGTSTLRLSVAGYPNVDTVIEVSLPDPSLRVSVV